MTATSECSVPRYFSWMRSTSTSFSSALSGLPSPWSTAATPASPDERKKSEPPVGRKGGAASCVEAIERSGAREKKMRGGAAKKRKCERGRAGSSLHVVAVTLLDAGHGLLVELESERELAVL